MEQLSPSISYATRPDATPEAEVSALAAVYESPSAQSKGTASSTRAAQKMREKGSMMLAPIPIIVHDPPNLLGDVREALSLRPALAAFPARLAEYLEADDRAVRACLEALVVEDEVLA